MEKLLYVLLIINCIVGAAFLLLSLVQSSGKTRFVVALYGILIILCPFLGFFIVMGIGIAYHILPQKNIDLSDVSFSHKKHGTESAPDESEEMQVTPLQDMFLVGSTEEKRRAMFFVLKQDIERYLNTLSNGISNEDSETSHYAASTLMKYSSEFSTKIHQVAVIFQENPKDYDVNRTYADAVKRYLSAQIVTSDTVRRKYRFLYCDLMENLSTYHESRLNPEDYVSVMKTYLDLKNASSAEKWVMSFREKFPRLEESYLAALEFYFRTGRNGEFNNCMTELKNSAVTLSAKGVNLLRFFETGNQE